MEKFLAALTAGFLLLPSFASAQEERVVSVLPPTTSQFEQIPLGDLPDRMATAIGYEINQRSGWSASVSELSVEELREEFGCENLRSDTSCAVRASLRLNSDYLVYGHIQRASGDRDPRLIVNLDLFSAARQQLYATAVEHTPPMRVLRDPARLAGFIAGLVAELMQNVERADARHGRTSAPHTPDIDNPWDPSRGSREILPPEGSEPQVPDESPDPTPATNDNGYSPTLFGHLGWVAVGLTAVSAGLMIGSMTHLNSLNENTRYHNYRLQVPVRLNGMRLDVCDEARNGNGWGASDDDVAHAASICDEAGTWETMQNVFIGTTVVFGLAAGVLHLLDGLLQGMDDMQGIAIAPSIGPDHGYLGLTGRF